MKATGITETRFATLVVAFVVAMASLAVVAVGPADAATTWNVPGDFATIQAAINGAAAGDTIVVAPGTYRENLLYGGKDVRVETSGGSAVTTINARKRQGVDIGPGGAMVGFTITNGRDSSGAAMAVHGSGTLIAENLFEGNTLPVGGSGAAIRGNTSSPTIAGNVFTNNTCEYVLQSAVIDFYNGSSPLIVNNVIHDNDCRGIDMTMSVGNAPLVINNTIIGNPVGLKVGVQDAIGHVYRNNLFLGNDVGVHIGGAKPVLENNLVFGNTTSYSGIADQTGSNGNISIDPLLADVGSGDFHLTPGSPAIDAGSATDAPSVDSEGEPRPRGAGIDIGADEFMSANQGISGILTHSGGTAISGACVSAFDLGLSQVAQTTTARTGRYELGLDPDNYLVEFSDCGLGAFTTEWHDDQATWNSATTTTVQADVVLTDIDADLVVEITCNGLAPTHVGTSGDDTILGTKGPDVIVGLGGNDDVRSRGGNDTVCGGRGNDTLSGGGGIDTLLGESGADTVIGGAADDALFGGSGLDTLSYQSAGGPIVADLALGTAGGAGNDSFTNFENIVGSPHDDIIRGDAKNNRLSGRGGNDDIDGRGFRDTLQGDAGNDILKGGASSDSLSGGTGDDVLYGNPGNDTLRGDTGADVLLGGRGDDDMNGGNDLSDTVSFETSKAGVTVDLVAGAASGEGADILSGFRDVVGSRRADNLTGNSADNLLFGLGGADVMSGGGGRDVLVGGAGSDTLNGNGGNDLLAGERDDDVLRGGSGFDAATWQFSKAAITANLTTGTSTGQGVDTLTNIEDLVGSEDHGDLLTGDGNGNVVYGLGGNDQLFGQAGPDALIGGPGNDSLFGESGDDYLNGQEGSDTLNGGTGSDLCEGGESHTSCEALSAASDMSDVVPGVTATVTATAYIWPRRWAGDGSPS